MAQVRAYVYHDGVMFRVYPAVVILKEGDKFELVNTVDEDCTWTVPAGAFEGGKVSVKVDKKSKSAARPSRRDRSTGPRPRCRSSCTRCCRPRRCW